MVKKKKEVKFRHYLITRILRPFLALYYKISYRLSYKKYPELKNKGPFVVLANHTIATDPIALGLSFPFLLYYIATEQIFNLGFISKLLTFAVNPIKKSKSHADISTIRKVKRIVNEGGSIGIYPEGNITYSGRTVRIEYSTVKLIRLLKLPVIIVVKNGLFLSNPRWSVNRKKGKASQEVREIIYPEQYLNLSDDELYKLISDLLYVDAYDKQKENPILFKGKEIALGLERLIFIDLDTNIPFTTYSKGNQLLSTNSNFKLIYQEDGYVKTNNNQLKTLYEIENEVKLKYFDYYYHNQDKLYFEEEIIIFETKLNKKVNIGTFKIILLKDQFIFEKDESKFEILFDDIESLAIQGKRQNIIYTKDKTYLIKLNNLSSPYKYLLTYQYYLFIKEGGSKINEQLYQFGL